MERRLQAGRALVDAAAAPDEGANRLCSRIVAERHKCWLTSTIERARAGEFYPSEDNARRRPNTQTTRPIDMTAAMAKPITTNCIHQ